MIPLTSSGKSRVSQCNIPPEQIKWWARLTQRMIKQLNNFPCNSLPTLLNTLRNTDSIRNVHPIVSAWTGRKKSAGKNDTSPGIVKGLCCVLSTTPKREAVPSSQLVCSVLACTLTLLQLWGKVHLLQPEWKMNSSGDLRSYSKLLKLDHVQLFHHPLRRNI